MIRAIVFDFDGIIADTEPLHYEAFLRIVQRDYNVTFTYEDYLRDYVGFDDRDGFREIVKRASDSTTLDSDTLLKLIADKADAFETIVNEGVESIAGVLDFIPQASAALAIAIASGAGRADIDVINKKLQLADTFSVIVSADDVARSKPDPETYRNAVAQLASDLPDLQPDQCLAIEDTVAGIESAREAGLHTLGMTTTTNEAALHRAHRVVKNFEGLTVSQLQEWFG